MDEQVRDTIYDIPENPVYNAEIRALQDSDPASASAVLNPLVQRLIENTHAVKQQANGLDGELEETNEAVREAKEAAGNAGNTANAALEAANAAGTAAANAGTAGGTALEAANNALLAAAEAKEAAESAETAAYSAKTAAENAAKDAGDAKTMASGALEQLTKLANTLGAVPSQNGTLTYTGAAQSLTLNGYDPEKMTLGGTTSATNAGTYTATVKPKGDYVWADGTQNTVNIVWTIGRASVTVPSQSGSLTYTGSALSPSWSGYDSGKLTLGGTTSGTNAGSYSATMTPKANYQWPDGSTAAKAVTWSIGKAVGSLALNKSSMSLNISAKTGTISVTRAGDGAISATSSNTSVATVSVSGTTVTVTSKANGSATITVSVAAGTNHTAPADKTCSVSATYPVTTLSSNSWATIKQASDAGQAANYWSVGDTKTITINGRMGDFSFSNLSVQAFIIGFNHNSSREGSNRIHFQIGKISGKDICLCDSHYGSYDSSSAGWFKMNTTNTNSGGWSNSLMRKTLLGNSGTPTSPPANSLLAALPSDLRAVMKSVTKYSDNTGGGSDTASYVTSTTDYLFLLSEFEYHGARSYANSAEKTYQLQYNYYKAGNSRIKYKHTDTATAAYHWCRSVYSSGSNFFCRVNGSGNAGSSNALYSWGVAPGFAA